MTWNHRVVKTVPKYFTEEYEEHEQTWYQVHEVHYEEDGTIAYYTENAIAPAGTTVQELREHLNQMLRALDKPILTEIDGKLTEI